MYNRKGEKLHGLSSSVKCVAPLFIDMSFAKYEMQDGAYPPPSSSALDHTPSHVH